MITSIPGILATGRTPYDVISNKLAMYGFRRLVSSYSGFLVRIRRGSDNVEQSFTDCSLIPAFLGADTGFITIWFDQIMSGGIDRSWVQATAARQPEYRHTGFNNKPSVFFNGLLGGGLQTTSSGNPFKLNGSLIYAYHRITESRGFCYMMSSNGFNDTLIVGFNDPGNSTFMVSSSSGFTNNNAAGVFSTGQKFIVAQVGLNANGTGQPSIGFRVDSLINTVTGHMPELIIVDGAISSSERITAQNIMNSYLTVY